MKYQLIDNKIIFDKPIKKGNNNIKVYFYREIDERKTHELPIATTNGNGTNEYTWILGFHISTIHIRQPKFFGFLKGKWEVVEEELLTNTSHKL